MAAITYVEPDGTRNTVEVPDSTSVMRGAVDNGVEGIVAECGGCCMCATCHVYLPEEYWPIFGEPAGDELAMLEETAAERKDISRLSCQLRVTADADGVEVYIPETQG